MPFSVGSSIPLFHYSASNNSNDVQSDSWILFPLCGLISLGSPVFRIGGFGRVLPCLILQYPLRVCLTVLRNKLFTSFLHTKISSLAASVVTKVPKPNLACFSWVLLPSTETLGNPTVMCIQQQLHILCISDPAVTPQTHQMSCTCCSLLIITDTCNDWQIYSSTQQMTKCVADNFPLAKPRCKLLC